MKRMLLTHLPSALNEMNAPLSDELIAIGVIARARGIRGEVKVKPLTDFPDRFNGLERILLEMPDGSVESRELELSKFAGGNVILKMTGVDDRNAAEKLKGSYVCVTQAETVPLEEDTFYIFDIEGMDVFDLSENRVGSIARVEQFPANDVIVVGATAGEIMIPAVKRYVIDVDKDRNRIIVDLTDVFADSPRRGKEMKGLAVSVLTIFPGMFEGFLNHGIVRRAVEGGLLDVEVVNIRDSATDRHGTVDDMPYGGGAGMVMKTDVLAASLDSTAAYRNGRRPPVYFLTPQGKKFDQSQANRMSMLGEFIIVCGRYRGVDERFREMYVTDELSIGDFVISGGEPAAMVVIDAVTRLIPGVLHDFESGIDDSFQNGLLDCPWYTRPEVFRDVRVPDVLLSGNHEKIRKWRNEQAILRTKKASSGPARLGFY